MTWDKPTRVPLDDDMPRHRRRKGNRRKPFIVEARYVRNSIGVWHSWKKYETAEDRDKALRQLRLSHGSMFGVAWMEFRAVDSDQ